jgi:dolichyl-phosphate-mannose-protein mannosyltransferase
MATARTTGADAQAEELRRRNVAGQTASPAVNTTQIKEKSKEKVRMLQARINVGQHS